MKQMRKLDNNYRETRRITNLILLGELGEVLQHQISLSQCSGFSEGRVAQHRTFFLAKH